MLNVRYLWLVLALGVLPACSAQHTAAVAPPPRDASTPAAASAAAEPMPRTGAVPHAALPGESHLTNLRMLTHGGENAEAYFSADGRQLIFQSTPVAGGCDQMYVMDVEGSNLRRVSTGEGRTTCGYFFPAGDRILYSSTHHRSRECPPPPDRSRGYVWPLHPYDIFVAGPDGSGLRQLTDRAGYDAEATISRDGSRIVFTSDRDGDLEIYTMNADGGDLRRLTHEEGYDGGAFFSPDGSKIVYRAYHPIDPAELEDYRSLLHERLIRPGLVELWVMDADGSNKRQITRNGAANFAPFFHPNGHQVIFSSNLHNPGGRDFDLYLIDLDGSGLRRITHNPDFDGFPMFSPDGTQLVFASNRGAQQRGDTNLFIAEWVEQP